MSVIAFPSANGTRVEVESTGGELRVMVRFPGDPERVVILAPTAHEARLLAHALRQAAGDAEMAALESGRP